VDEIIDYRQVYEQDGARWVPLTAYEMVSLLAGTLNRRVTYVGSVPCRYHGPVPQGAAPHPVLLVCEGRCNPDVTQVDRRVRRAYQQYGALDDEALEAQRALRHTLHDPCPDGQYRCRACRRVRGYGG
jgi:hypothetical protein